MESVNDDNDIEDTHPDKTGVFIKQGDSPYLERNIDGSMQYDTVPLYEDIDCSIRLLEQSTEHWCVCKDTSFVTLLGIEDKLSSRKGINSKLLASAGVIKEDFNSAPRVFEHEYQMEHFGFDDSAIRLCVQANVDYLNDLDISTSDITDMNAPLQPRAIKVTPIDYEI